VQRKIRHLAGIHVNFSVLIDVRGGPQVDRHQQVRRGERIHRAENPLFDPRDQDLLRYQPEHRLVCLAHGFLLLDPRAVERGKQELRLSRMFFNEPKTGRIKADQALGWIIDRAHPFCDVTHVRRSSLGDEG
jgi:hypothetical protein